MSAPIARMLEVVTVCMSRREVRQIITALKQRQDIMEARWRTIGTKKYLSEMRALQELRCNLQRAASTR